MDPSHLPDNLPELLDLCIQNTTGEIQKRFIAIRDEPDVASKTTLFQAFRRESFADKRLTKADRWLTELRPFFEPEVYIPLPPVS